MSDDLYLLREARHAEAVSAEIERLGKETVEAIQAGDLGRANVAVDKINNLLGVIEGLTAELLETLEGGSDGAG